MKSTDLQDKKTGYTRNVIAIFARAPRIGKAKTRLAKTIGDEAAREVYAAMLRDVYAYARAAASQIAECEIVVFYTPESAFAHPSDSLHDYWSGARRFQGEGDLGQRLNRCFEGLRSGGAQHIVVIGSDAPDLPLSVFSEAFRLLEVRDFVFGASADGGFYLMGVSCEIGSNLFRNVRWSSENTLNDVLQNLEARRANFLQVWRDVDDIDDLRALHSRLRKGESIAPHTLRVLDVYANAQKRLLI